MRKLLYTVIVVFPPSVFRRNDNGSPHIDSEAALCILSLSVLGRVRQVTQLHSFIQRDDARMTENAQA